MYENGTQNQLFDSVAVDRLHCPAGGHAGRQRRPGPAWTRQVRLLAHPDAGHRMLLQPVLHDGQAESTRPGLPSPNEKKAAIPHSRTITKEAMQPASFFLLQTV